MLRTITLELDDMDYDAVQKEFSHRQTRSRDEFGTVLPDCDSNLAGAMVAELVQTSFWLNPK